MMPKIFKRIKEFFSSKKIYTHPNIIKTKEGLRYYDIVTGQGKIAEIGQRVTLHYRGWLYCKGRKGRKFSDSYLANNPIVYTLGTGQVLQCGDLGIPGMRTGGQRLLIVPAKLAHAEKGSYGTIPPHSDLIFQVELVAVDGGAA